MYKQLRGINCPLAFFSQKSQLSLPKYDNCLRGGGTLKIEEAMFFFSFFFAEDVHFVQYWSQFRVIG